MTLKRNADNNCDVANVAATKVIKFEEDSSTCIGDSPSKSQSLPGSSLSTSSTSASSLTQTTTQESSTGQQMQNGRVTLTPTKSDKNCCELQKEKFNQIVQDCLNNSFSIKEYRMPYENIQPKHNLTENYNQFWNALLNLPGYTTGSNIKLINSSLDEETISTIAKILKRGWEDERYFPKCLAQPLLEACIFNTDHETQLDLKTDMFCMYITPDERLLIKTNEKNTVNEKCLKVFQKYYPEGNISIGDTIESACKEVLGKIMFKNIGNILHIWTEEIVGLLEFEQFKFLTNDEQSIQTHIVHSVYKPPHECWGTFFYRWSDRMVEFYFRLLKHDSFEICNICKKADVSSSHIVSIEDDIHSPQGRKHLKMLKERHEVVLNKIVKKLKVAFQHRNAYFSVSDHWKMIVIRQNFGAKWPSELSFLKDCRLYPHIFVYSTNPTKKILIVEITISYSPNSNLTKGSKYEKYQKVVEVLESDGFEVEFKNIVLCSRGTFVVELYELFEQVCGMKHSEVSKTMEKISKRIIEVAFNFQYQYHLT